MFCYFECTQTKVDLLQIRNMYYSYLYDQKFEYFKLNANDHTNCHAMSSQLFSLLHTNT